MANHELHDTVLDLGSARARVAKVYAEALLAAAMKKGGADAVDEAGQELDGFVSGVLRGDAGVSGFLASPAVGKRAKINALAAALPGRISDTVRGLFGVLVRNGRLDLVPGIAAAFRQLLDDRAGRVRVKVTSAVELSEGQRSALADTLAGVLKQQPVLDVRVDPGLLGGMVVQIGDRVVDTSVRTRLETLRTQLLDKGSSYVANV